MDLQGEQCGWIKREGMGNKERNGKIGPFSLLTQAAHLVLKDE
jgi:hypothetical protein